MATNTKQKAEETCHGAGLSGVVQVTRPLGVTRPLAHGQVRVPGERSGRRDGSAHDSCRPLVLLMAAPTTAAAHLFCSCRGHGSLELTPELQTTGRHLKIDSKARNIFIRQLWG